MLFSRRVRFCLSLLPLGRPRGRRRIRRPRQDSTLLRKVSSPRGRPVRVCRRKRFVMSSEAAAVFSTDFHSRAGICTNKSPGESRPDGSAPFLQCIAALDQGYSQAWAAIPARTGFSSTYAYIKFQKRFPENCG